MPPMQTPFVTPIEWGRNLQHPSYGADDTYRLAASWVADCATVADWGGGAGHLQRFLRPGQSYVCVDGTAYFECAAQLADLTNFQQPADGIVLRHVLDQSEEWRTILENAMVAARKRIVVVTFTPDADRTARAKVKSGWPVMRFNPFDLRAAMGPWRVTDRAVRTSHPERVYYLERPCAS